jgi:oligoribonuclease
VARWALIAGPKNSPKTDHALALAQALRSSSVDTGGFLQVKRADGDGGKVYELQRVGRPGRVLLAAERLALPADDQFSYCSLAFRREAFAETHQWLRQDAQGARVLFVGEVSKVEAGGQGHAESFRYALSLPDDVLLVVVVRSDQLFYVMEKFALDDEVVASLELPLAEGAQEQFYADISRALGRQVSLPGSTPPIVGAGPGAMLWLDLEMSGLDPQRERILEIATVITDRDLNVVGEGPDLVVHQSDEVLSRMDGWNTKHHRKSGLTQAVRQSRVTEDMAEQQTVDFLDQLSPGRRPLLAGNSMWLDRVFLRRYMSRLHDRIHYRSVDVTSLRELVKRWAPDVYRSRPAKVGRHRAKDDVIESIAELRHYRNHLFVPYL